MTDPCTMAANHMNGFFSLWSHPPRGPEPPGVSHKLVSTCSESHSTLSPPTTRPPPSTTKTTMTSNRPPRGMRRKTFVPDHTDTASPTTSTRMTTTTTTSDSISNPTGSTNRGENHTDEVSSPESPSSLPRASLAFIDEDELGMVDSLFGEDSVRVQATPPPSERIVMKRSFCVPNATTVFRRRVKVNAGDLESVENASDTMVPLSNRTQITGREMHENAKAYFYNSDYPKALVLFEAILSAQVRRFSVLHPSVGAAMHNVGVCHLRLGHHGLAESLFGEAVQIRRQTMGPRHIQVAASLSKLGEAQLVLRKRDEAHENFVEALSIARQHVGQEHKMVAQILGQLGCFYFEVDELFAAQASFAEALTIYRAIWPTEMDRDACMAQLTDMLCNVGAIQNRRKLYKKAIQSFTEALDLQRGILGHDDPLIIATLDNLAYSHSKQKDYGSAMSCYRKQLRAQMSHFGTFTTECHETFRKQLLMFEKLNRIADAISETKEILQIQKSMNTPTSLVRKTNQLLDRLYQLDTR